jgi:cyclopropane fatty-acyl-phospholipid synthase-like methyltransferase
LADVAAVEAALEAVPMGGELLELGSGTGYWTERLAARATIVTALDAAPEMIDEARARLSSVENVEFQVVDLVDGWAPGRTWDGAVGCFFLEHVPDRLVHDLLARLRDALRPDAPVFFVDGAHRAQGGDVEVRDLGGRAYRVIERRRSPSEIEEAFDRAGFDIEVRTIGGRFSVSAGSRR